MIQPIVGLLLCLLSTVAFRWYFQERFRWEVWLTGITTGLFVQMLLEAL